MFDTGQTNEEVFTLIVKTFSCNDPGPDIIGYGIEIALFTDEEWAVYSRLKAVLGDDVSDFVILIITRHPDHHAVSEMLQHRYVVFDHSRKLGNSQSQVKLLLEAARELKKRNGDRSSLAQSTRQPARTR